MNKKLLALLFSFFVPATLQAQTTITVCASGCTYTNANIQTAIYAAVSGDTILLQTAFIYPGTVILPQKTGTTYTTIRTGVTSIAGVMALGDFPAANVRLTAANNANLAKFQATANNEPGLRTTFPASGNNGCATPCVASYWKVQWIEVLSHSFGGSAMVDLGSNGTTGSMPGGDTQNTAAEEPHHLILDQVYIHGHAVTGQFRGVMIAARDVQILNSTISDIRSLGEGQGIWSDNSTGNITITNNDIQANAENVIFGGDQPRMAVDTTVLASPAPTTTTFTMAATAADFLTVGQGLSVVVGGVKKYTHVTAIAGAALTVEALSAAPDVPGAVNYSVVPKNLTFTKNWLSKPVAWRDPWLNTPVVTPTCSITGGTMAAGTYYYRITALLTVAAGAVATSTASVEVSCAIASGTTGSVSLSWPAVTNATSYNIYGRTPASENVKFTGTSPFVDTGATGTTEAVPTGTGSRPQVKNVFEIKKWHTATIDGNVFDYSWEQAQTGYAILFTVLNDSIGTQGNDSAVVRNITFTNNKIRHATGAMQLSGRAADGDISDRTQDITISNNVFEDIGTAWGAKENLIIVTSGVNAGTTTDRGPLNVSFNHNTFINLQGKSQPLFNLYSSSTQYTADNFDFTNNLLYRNDYGLRNTNSGGLGTEGNTSWLEVAGTGSTWLNNGMAGANCTLYPGPPISSFCPSTVTFEASFVNYAGGNYRLTGTSFFDNAGTDGLDVGANIDTIEALTNIALSGNNNATNTTPIVAAGVDQSITLPAGSTLNATVTDDGLPSPPATLTYAWTKTSGPGTVTFGNAAAVDTTATYSLSGTYVLRLTSSDSVLSAYDELTVTVAPVPPTVSTISVRADRFALNTGPCILRSGTGSPEGVITGNVCDTYWQTDAGSIFSKTSSGAVTAVSVRSSSIGTAASGTAVSVAMPAGTIAGDVVSVIVHANGDATTIVDNNGATPFTENLNDLTQVNHTWSIFSRRMVSGDPSTYNFTIGSSQRWTAVAVTFKDPNATSIYDISPTSTNALAITTISSPSITTITNNAIHVAVAGIDGNTLAYTGTPAGYTVLQGGGNQAIWVSTKVITTASSTGAQAYTGAPSSGQFGISFAIKSSTSTAGTTGWKAGVTGLGTTNTIAKWASTTTLGDSSALTESGSNLIISPAGDIVVDPIGNDILPVYNYDVNLGALTNKFLTLHAAELWVETLVAQNTMATIGGRVLVAPTTILTADLATGGTSITVKYNNLENGARIYMEADGKVEFMAVASTGCHAAATPPYTCTVTRSLDPSGANQWYAGDAVLNTGTTGNGFIDLYSVRGVKAGTEIGPTIVGNVRNSTTYNDWSPRWAIGNLNGLYDYATNIYGAAFGVPTAAWIKIDPTNGIRIGHNVTNKITLDAAGNATFAGIVQASGGAIGGWNIFPTYLTYDTGTNSTSAGMATNDSPFYAGATYANRLTAPFRVTMAGELYASAGNVAGALTVGSITTNKLLVQGSGSALNSDPEMTDSSAWIYYNGVSSSIITGLTDGQVGTTSLRSGTGAAAAGSWYRSNLIPYDAAKAYTLRTWVRRSATSDGVYYAGVLTYDAAQAPLTTVFFAAAGNLPTTGWTNYTGTMAAGAVNAATRFISPLVITNYAATVGYAEVQGVRLEEAIPSVLIQDGAITAVKILADSITAGQIAANAITTSELNADSVTSAKIVANTIVAADIAANTITAGQIAANTITAGQIAAGTITATQMNVSTLSAITANLGDVNAGTIEVGSTNRIWLNYQSLGTFAIGGSNINTAPFFVSNIGNLTVGSATVTGDLTVTGTSITFTPNPIFPFQGGGTSAACLDNNGKLYRGTPGC